MRRHKRNRTLWTGLAINALTRLPRFLHAVSAVTLVKECACHTYSDVLLLHEEGF